MEDKRILFFADSTQDSTGLVDAVLKHRPTHGPLLSFFLDQTSVALKEEWEQLPSSQRALLPDFQSLDFLSEHKLKSSTRHPALDLVQLVLVQLAQFINSYEHNPSEPYPTPEDTICVGVCFGQVAAAAVALSQSLSHLVPLAVHAVRIAFRGGVLASETGEDIESFRKDSGTWALSLPRDSGLDSPDKLASLHKQINIASHKRVWLSAIANTSITLSGPPTTLDSVSKFLVSLSDGKPGISLRRLPISGPYHAPHLYSDASIVGVVPDVGGPFSLESYSRVNAEKQITLIGGFGTSPQSESVQQFFQEVIDEIYMNPIDWQKIVDKCTESWKITPTAVSVRTFGPDAQGKHLASTIGKSGIKVVFDSDFSRPWEPELTSFKEPLAIVGMSGRFPTAGSPQEFWEMLCNGTDAVQEVPTDRFDKDAHFDHSIFGCFLERPGHFDPGFFHMSPREATNTDPAHRLGLTCVQEAMDKAGFVPNSTPSSNAANIGCFWGNATEEYKEEYMSQHVDPYYIPGSSRAFGPGRVNFFYKFDGPTASFDTACSSSLVAMNHACNSIWSGDSATAIVVGSNILCAPYSYKGLDLGHFLSRTGGCKSFDEQADGYCRGEAIATVILKRISVAEAENDNILGVIRAISTNHSSNASSITRPHGPTQEKLFKRLLKQSNLGPNDISYVEMHGTGTQAGDTTEMTSVLNVFAPEPRDEDSPLWVGAVKSNVGHGEGASGITSLVKSLLMLQEKKIPPHIGIKSGIRRKEPDVGAKNVQIASDTVAWTVGPDQDKLRRVLISNFSAAAGNTAMIVEEYRPEQHGSLNDTRQSQVITISAKSSKALSENVSRLLEWTKSQQEIDLSSLSYSLTTRRVHHEHRCSFPVRAVADLEKQLEKHAAAGPIGSQKSSGVVVLFSGFSNMWPTAMRELFDTSSYFRSEVLRLDQIVLRQGFESTIATFDVGGPEIPSFVQKQLAYVISQVAMFKLIRSWGVDIAATTGHSFGEYAACYASGLLSAEDLIYIVGSRATALEKRCNLESHGMLAIQASHERAQTILGADTAGLELSCINGPSSIVLSGETEKLNEVKASLASAGVTSQRVDTPLAFHSSQMDGISEDLATIEDVISMSDPGIPLLSPTEGRLVSAKSGVGPRFLQRHTRSVVDFQSAVNSGSAENLDVSNMVWIEVGPHGICTPMVRSILGAGVQSAPLMRRDESAWATVSAAMSVLYSSGQQLDWREYHRDYIGQQTLLDLPLYALDEKHFWLPSGPAAGAAKPAAASSTAVSQQVQSKVDIKIDTKSVHRISSSIEHDGLLVQTFETDLLHPELYEIMRGHTMNDSHLCPASLYTEIALTIGSYLRSNTLDIQQNQRACVADLSIHKPIIAPYNPSEAELTLRSVSFTDLHDKQVKIRFETTGSDGKSHVHAQCRVYFEKGQEWLNEWSKVRGRVTDEIYDLEAKLFRGRAQKLLKDLVYRLFDSVVIYGQYFRSLGEVIVDEGGLKASATVNLYQGPESEGYECCPFWMDGLAHLAGFLINGLREGSEKAVYISPGWLNFRMAKAIDPTATYKVFVELEDNGSTVNAQCYILLGDQIVGTCDGLKFQLLPRSVINKVLPPGGPRKRQAAPAPTRAPAPAQRQPRYGEDVSDDSDDDNMSSVSTELETPDSLDDGQQIDLVTILGEETGLGIQKIADDQDLVDLGVDSLLSLTITDRLRDEFKLDMLPSDLFQKYMTFGALSSYINSLTGAPKPQVKKVKAVKEHVAPQPASVKPTTQAPPASEEQSSSSKMAKVREIIAEQMGMEPQELKMTDNLSDMGLDSLMTLEIAEAVQAELGMEVDSTLFTSTPTLKDIELALFGAASAPEPKQQSHSKSKIEPRAEAGDQATISIAPNQKLIVCLQGNPQRSSKKLFLFPDGGGSAGVYSQLPLIDGDLCVYGLNSPYLKQGVVPGVTIANLVNTWVSEVLSCQPDGPYRLAGYSSGGYFAYEAAKLLATKGKQVETLILIDSPSRSVYEALPEEALDAIMEKGVIGGQTPKSTEDCFRTSVQAVAAYKPTPFPPGLQPETYLIFAEDGIEQVRDVLQKRNSFDSGISKFFAGTRGAPRPHGWVDLIQAQNIHLASTPGTHFSLLFSQNAASVSRLMAAAVTGDKQTFNRLPQTATEVALTSPAERKSYDGLTDAELLQVLSRKATDPEMRLKHDLDKLVHTYIRKVLASVSASQVQRLEPHIQRYHRWMQNVVSSSQHPSSSEATSAPDESVASLEADLAGIGVDGELLSRVGKHILPIVRGEQQPLEIMLKDNLLFRYYPGNIHTSPLYSRVATLLRREREVQGRPLRIVEIGAGTGATTKAALAAIAALEGSSNATQYTYTDVSAGFFKKAKDAFREHAARMTFKKLDIEKSPLTQDFEEGSYDVVLASQCLHATKNMSVTMANTRKLLRPGGKVIMVEGTREALDISFIFGVLPGWWLGEEENRQMTPCLDLDGWRDVLKKTGFSGADLVVPNVDVEEHHTLSVVVSTAV